MIYLIILLILLAGLCRGFAEALQFAHSRSIFRRAKPVSFFGSESWLRKFKPNAEILASGEYWAIPAPKNWYYKLIDVMFIEKFPGSATVFVCVTDGFHLFNMLMKVFIVAAIVLHQPNEHFIIEIIAYALAWSGGFSISYNLISIRK